MKDTISLYTAPVGSEVRIYSISSTGIQRRRFLDLGIIPGSKITVERKSPSGNPIAYRIRGSVIALRNDEAENIKVNII